jgi:hypothetical protein
MAVDVRGDGVGGVPEHLLHDFDVLTGRNERRGGAGLSVCSVTPVSSARSAIAAKARSAFRGSVGVPICVGNNTV